MKNFSAIIIALLVGLIPVFVSVTLWSVSKSNAALERANEVQHSLEVHATEQVGAFKVLDEKLDRIHETIKHFHEGDGS